MARSYSSKQSRSRPSPFRLLLSFGLPLLLLLSFLLSQFIKLDSIGWNEGFNHPLSGWDHLATMVAVGIWAAQLRGQAIWMLPLAFVGVMSLGGLAGAADLAIPSVEGIILLSCAVFSVLITRRVRFNTYINLLIVAFFAFFHGFAHGHEISTSTSLMSYTLGFMLATLILHGSGILIAKLVMLSITFLLTAMFSASAMAKAQLATMAQGHGDVSHVFQNSAWFGAGGFTDADDWSMQQRCHFAAQDNLADIAPGGWRVAWAEGGEARKHQNIGFDGIDPNLADATTTLGSAFSDSSPRASISDIKKLPTDANFADLAETPPSGRVPVGERGYQLVMPVYHSPLVLAFKNFFPQINDTPGLPLLNGGVGLTSPPVASNAPANSPDVRTLCKTSISPVAAHSLPPLNTGIKRLASFQNHRQDHVSCDQAFPAHDQTSAIDPFVIVLTTTLNFPPNQYFESSA